MGSSERFPELDIDLVPVAGEADVHAHVHAVCALEREAVAWLMDLWECDGNEDFWGSVGASGTEGNLWALYLAREALPNAFLFGLTGTPINKRERNTFWAFGAEEDEQVRDVAAYVYSISR